MYLTKTEIKTILVPQLLEKLINGDDSIIEEIIEESIDVMSGFLKQANYDTEAIFKAEEENRSKTLLKYLKRIVKYELYARKDMAVDDDTQNQYDEAMSALRDIAMGKTSLNIDDEFKITPSAVGDGFIKFGGRTKYESSF